MQNIGPLTLVLFSCWQLNTEVGPAGEQSISCARVCVRARAGEKVSICTRLGNCELRDFVRSQVERRLAMREKERRQADLYPVQVQGLALSQI